jgi:hypothetical protein
MDTKQEIASQYVIANKQECVDLLQTWDVIYKLYK